MKTGMTRLRMIELVLMAVDEGIDTRPDLAEEYSHVGARSSIYGAVSRLTSDGLIRAIETGRVGNRGPRVRYELTDTGRERLAQITGASDAA